MSVMGKFLVWILCLFLSYGLGNADICYDDYDNFEKACPDSVFSPSETYCCGTPGLHYCCDSDDYELYNDVVDSISTAIIIVIVIVVVIVVGTIGGIIACCVCGCLCCARSRPVTRTYVTTQPVQGQALIQQQAYYTPPGAAYPPPAGAAYPPPDAAYPPPPVAYPPPPGGEKAPNYPV